MRHLTALGVAATAAARLAAAPQPDDPDDLSREQKIMFSLISGGLVLLAGLMSGLTLGLLQLDAVDLEVLRRSGTDREKRHAAAIEPVVRHPHRLLVTLVLANAAAMEALPIFLDRLTDPVTAVVLSITVVLLFGEVAPQAICSRYGLAVGAHCVWFVKVLMAVTWPVAAPLAAVLDAVLGGHEGSALFRRAQLKALVDAHGEDEGLGGTLTHDEIAVIRGALDLSSKTAADCATPLDKVFSLPADARLDAATLAKVVASGHSRIPVHAPGRKDQMVGMLLAKELILIDANRPPRVGDLNVRSLPFLHSTTSLYDMLKLFESGRCHMAVLVAPPRSVLGGSLLLGGSPPSADGGVDDNAAPSSPRAATAKSMLSRLAAGEAMAEVLKARGDRAAARARAAARGPLPLVGSVGDELAEEAAAGEGDGEHAADGDADGRPAAAAAADSDSSSSTSSDDTPGRVIGLVTLEDVLEELIGAEIFDETDQWMDAATQTKRVNAAALAARLPANLRALLRESAPRVAPPARGGAHGALPVAPNAVQPRDGARPAVGGWALPPPGERRSPGDRARSAGPPARRPGSGRWREEGGLAAPLLGGRREDYDWV